MGLILYSEELFRDGLDFYRNGNPSGAEIYQFLLDKAKDYGYEFDLSNCGHLIGLFAHSACYKEGMRYFTDKMQPGIWILEIQIRDPRLNLGAFLEDILI